MWFRRDLRLDDNPAWSAAAATHREIVPLFVLDPRLFAAAGPFRRRQLIGDLTALDLRLRALGGCLRVVQGDAVEVLALEATKLQSDSVFVNLDVSPLARRRDTAVATTLAAGGITWHGSWGGLVHAPGTVRTARGTLSQVFTPYWHAWRTTTPQPWVTIAPQELTGRVAAQPEAALPKADGLAPYPGGEFGAQERLHLAHDLVDDYPAHRDQPSIDGTTQLSAALRFGTISPRRIIDSLGMHTPGRDAVARQLAWRDWFAHIAWEHPDLASCAMRPEYDQIAWRDDEAGFEAWRAGRTGYPIVDAGMRELAQTGWMHGRVRMIAASFLVKHLLIDWRRGERWFRTTLVDGEFSQNAGNWQWVAGTGLGAAPYFRVFNPTTQAKRFDADGTYVKRWIPELRTVDARRVHEPWLLDAAELPPDYPPPLVDHKVARARCLAAYAAARDRSTSR